jgi:hypothetical protein
MEKIQTKSMALVAANNEIKEYQDDIRLLKTMLNYLEGNEDSTVRIEIHLSQGGCMVYGAENNFNVVSCLKAELVDVSNLLTKAETAQKEQEERIRQQNMNQVGSSTGRTPDLNLKIVGEMINMPTRNPSTDQGSSIAFRVSIPEKHRIEDHLNTVVFISNSGSWLKARVKHVRQITETIWEVFCTAHDAIADKEIFHINSGSGCYVIFLHSPKTPINYPSKL